MINFESSNVAHLVMKIRPTAICDKCKRKQSSPEIARLEFEYLPVKHEIQMLSIAKGLSGFMPVGWSSFGTKGIFCPECSGKHEAGTYDDI